MFDLRVKVDPPCSTESWLLSKLSHPSWLSFFFLICFAAGCATLIASGIEIGLAFALTSGFCCSTTSHVWNLIMRTSNWRIFYSDSAAWMTSRMWCVYTDSIGLLAANAGSFRWLKKWGEFTFTAAGWFWGEGARDLASTADLMTDHPSVGVLMDILESFVLVSWLDSWTKHTLQWRCSLITIAQFIQILPPEMLSCEWLNWQGVSQGAEGLP